jgi:hypothetical protein
MRADTTNIVQYHQNRANRRQVLHERRVGERPRFQQDRQRDERVAQHDESLVMRRVPEESHLLFVSIGLQHCVPKLPYEERGEPQAHRRRQIERKDGVAVDEHARADKVKHLVPEIIV